MINFKELGKTFLNLIYPCYCNFCERKILDGDIYFCNECYSSLHYLEITKKQKLDLQCDNSCSLFIFYPDSVSQKIIHLIKYEGKQNLGVKMGREFGTKLNAHNITADFIIPLPLHITRKRERGYNQAEVIAKGISQVLKIPLRTDIIKRYKYTQSQTKLNREERQANVRGAFLVKESDLTGKEIFILDDVITSGATMNECAKLLKERGAKNVTALSLALVHNTQDISAIVS
jgi:ComF family protein